VTADERGEIEGRADRALRRGELAGAMALYQQLAAAFPDDAAFERKLSQLRENLQPSELHSAKSNFKDAGTTEVVSHEAEGERLFALGDHAGAISAYRRALEKKPGSELIQERLIELFRLVKRPSAPRDRAGLLQDLLDRIASRRSK
jgi:tetratricopeptide (TPR) repeat protein